MPNGDNMLTKDYIRSVTEEKLSESDYKKIEVAEKIIDNTLILHGKADVWLACTKNPLIKDYLAKHYRSGGWDVSYMEAARSGTYYIQVK